MNEHILKFHILGLISLNLLHFSLSYVKEHKGNYLEKNDWFKDLRVHCDVVLVVSNIYVFSGRDLANLA